MTKSVESTAFDSPPFYDMSSNESTPDPGSSDQILPRELTDAEKEVLANDTKLVPEFWRKKYEKVQ